MPAIPKTKTSQTVWVAKWDHKHGEDLTLHTTEEGAGKQCAAWAREELESWATPEELDFYKNLSDDDLISQWGELTGEHEYFSVEDHMLHSADVWEEVSEKTIKDVDVFEFPANK